MKVEVLNSEGGECCGEMLCQFVIASVRPLARASLLAPDAFLTRYTERYRFDPEGSFPCEDEF